MHEINHVQTQFTMLNHQVNKQSADAQKCSKDVEKKYMPKKTISPLNYSQADIKNSEAPKTKADQHKLKMQEVLDGVEKKQTAKNNATNYRFMLAKSSYW
ncbi:hypothetical protein [Kurthia sibirica]|uniref:Uncharacterized protein n=1 Tax=Kurthia sibirica TaxID=202750 RepID=A0A2U3AKG9_9BACL|nr:hypothetical protein [Kurthia sibirica]PWI25036.1 hypothetical protein DEX24_09830 [Kurthia sibirica]GEK34200.1 hypothetical protein KSI01_17330 [Kurthia sibirica]